MFPLKPPSIADFHLPCLITGLLAAALAEAAAAHRWRGWEHRPGAGRSWCRSSFPPLRGNSTVNWGWRKNWRT